MLYVQQSLGRDEELIHVGSFHWMYTVQAVMSMFWAVLIAAVIVYAAIYYQNQYAYGFYSVNLLGMMQEFHPGVRLGVFFVIVMGILKFCQMMIIKATTEIVVTTHRLIYKRGLVARHVGEISIDRIEGVNVLQTIWGRMFDYGRLAVRGMGVGEVVLPPVEHPILFRKAIDKARKMSGKSRDL
ncbi:MAG: PH domain-containing protein [Alphaproteobacteria bacterium]|jgi:hypothetical protein|nr:PH domain-containing protein [Alphaproteobacteria bacterium]MDP7222825.1 PH domain-containing protein [Alphaproteobacteria bacterium]